MKQIYLVSSLVPWYIDFNLGKERKLQVAWFFTKMLYISTLFNGKPLKGCFFLYLEKNMDNASYSSSRFFLTRSVSNYDLKELRMSVLKFYNKTILSNYELKELSMSVLKFCNKTTDFSTSNSSSI